MNRRRRLPAAGAAALALVILLSACGSGSQGSSGPSKAESASPSSAASAGASAPAPTATEGATGPANLDAPQEVAAGAKFDVTWTGPRALGDYITIVAATATQWTHEPYFDTHDATSPGSLVAPVKDGAYALWYVSGADGTILARRAIRVLPFTGDLGAPDEVMAGSKFEVAWNGPNGLGDYVTIVKVGATKWTNESYFDTSTANPGILVAALEAGAYEIWYVVGVDGSTQARRPITVTPYVVTLAAPDEVAQGAAFQVTWTGPDGPSDYITIVPAGSAAGVYGDYAYTNDGSPATLHAPTTAGNYEIRYQSDRVVNVVFGSRPIKVN